MLSRPACTPPQYANTRTRHDCKGPVPWKSILTSRKTWVLVLTACIHLISECEKRLRLASANWSIGQLIYGMPAATCRPAHHGLFSELAAAKSMTVEHWSDYVSPVNMYVHVVPYSLLCFPLSLAIMHMHILGSIISTFSAKVRCFVYVL
jgi:hypothetical protein